MNRPISALVNVALTPELGMAIVRDDQGWRFEAWRGSSETPALPPPGDDSPRYFSSLDEAVSYFRKRYQPITERYALFARRDFHLA
jgi:hypothetical protein